MTIAHLSDTHLGGGTLARPKMVDDPYSPGLQVRQQEADILRGMEQAVSRILDIAPDLVIHSGDLFDSAQPSPKHIDFAMEQLKRLSQAGISVVVVEGEHSCPRVPSRGHALRVLQHLPGVRAICTDCEKITIGDATIHAVPHAMVGHDGLPKRDAVAGDRMNVLVTHGVADGQRFFKTGRPAFDAPIRECALWYDYVALGHCHRFAQVPDTDRAFYAGATAPVTQGDFRPGHSWGFSVVTSGGSCPKVRFESIESRPMQAYGIDDAQGLSAREVFTFLERQANEVEPRSAYCQVIVQGLDPLARRELPRRDIEALFGEAAALQMELHVQELKRGEPAGSGEDLHARFERLVVRGDGDTAFKDAVRVVGRSLLDRAIQAVEAEDGETEDREVATV